VRKDFDLREVFKYINETALFKNQWQLKTASQEDYARLVNEKFRGVLQEVQDEVVQKNWYEPKAVYGYFQCRSEGNDVILYDPDGSGSEGSRFTFPASEKDAGCASLTTSCRCHPDRWT
jgi:5-methyltetrahydrofolate--homocysteine methyltransferase